MAHEPIGDPRIVVWFSCGAASACAARVALDRYDEVRLVYCDTSADEHPDNLRFLRDVEKWLGVEVERIRSEKYSRIAEVFEARKYMSGIKGAPCTVEMKKIPRFKYQQFHTDDVNIFGYTAEESKRAEDFEARNPDMVLDWVLIAAGITRQYCYDMLKRAGIELPVMYQLGYKNNNCIGCVKATSIDYWQKIKWDFPEVFRARAEQSRRIGARLVRVDGERVFLDEMPDAVTTLNLFPTEDISCGPECAGSN